MRICIVAALLAVTIYSPLLSAQDDRPLGDVARESRAHSEALRKANPNLRPTISEDGSSNDASGGLNDTQPDSTGAKKFVLLGLALDQAGKYDEALTAFKKAIELRPNYAVADYDIGVVKAEQGNDAGAITYYKQAIALDTSRDIFFINLTKSLFTVGRYAEAEDVGRRGLSLFPDDLDIMMNLGNALAAQHKYEEAIPYFQKILAVTPEDNEARKSLRYCLRRLGRGDEAESVSMRGLQTSLIRIEQTAMLALPARTAGISLRH